jgi:catechol 2,3-dioxygenase
MPLPRPGFRLPGATTVGRVRLQVADLQRSLDFYQRVLGLAILDRSATSASLTAEDDGRVLIELHEKRGVSPAPRRGAYGLYHFAILLPDRAALGRFVTHLAALGLRFGTADHWVSEAIYLTDPDGLGIEVYADRPRDEWQTRDDEVAMATEALDLDSLVTAAADRAWDVAPAGTVVGHVHLHVGDLRAAEAFYHSALGFDKTVWSYPGALFLSAGGYHHHLGTNTWSPGPSARDDEARLLHWELRLPDAAAVDAAVDSLRRAGYTAVNESGGWTAADPWGTTVKLVIW